MVDQLDEYMRGCLGAKYLYRLVNLYPDGATIRRYLQDGNFRTGPDTQLAEIAEKPRVIVIYSCYPAPLAYGEAAQCTAHLRLDLAIFSGDGCAVWVDLRVAERSVNPLDKCW